MNQPLKAIARNGRLVMDVPTDLPDGTEVDVAIVDDISDMGETWMDDHERKAFQDELRASAEDEEAERLVPAKDVIARLFANA